MRGGEGETASGPSLVREKTIERKKRIKAAINGFIVRIEETLNKNFSSPRGLDSTLSGHV